MSYPDSFSEYCEQMDEKILELVQAKCFTAALLAFNIAGYPEDKAMAEANRISKSTTI